MMYDLIIIGGGPAGVTAAIYAARHKLKTLLITRSFGGQIARKAVEIENYPGFEKISGLELIQRFEKQARKQNIDIERDLVEKVKKIRKGFLVATTSRTRFQSKAVIVASGADPRPLEVPGEKEFIGRGVSYCTACDAPLFQEKAVAVVGGGNSGFEAALALTNYARKVYILEFLPQVKADPSLRELARRKKVEVRVNAALKEIQGEKFVEAVVYQDRRSKKTIVLKVQGVFVEIGSQPATSFVRDLVDFSKRDEIIVDHKT
ncbi:MAG TPA: FAD-dependent oxidoreductase, partial [Calditrichaeota bacterium]|nr:FAD-dependent oxidoreductase [Calditrichota bacterium]